MTAMLRRGRLGIQARLIFLVLAAVLPLVALAIFEMFRAVENERARIEREVDVHARSLLADLDRHVSGIEAALQLLATSPNLQTDDLAGFHVQMTEALKIRGVGFVLFDTTGQQLANANRPFGESLPRRVDLSTINSVVETRLPQVTDLFIGTLLQRPILSVEVPVILGGRVRYILTLAMDPDDLSELLLAQNVPNDWTAGIYDRKGTVIGHSRNAVHFIGQPAPEQLRGQIARGIEGWFASVTIEGVPVYTTLLRSALTGWVVGIGVPRAFVDEPLRRAAWLAAGGGGAVLTLSLLLAAGMGRVIRRPVAALTEAAHALGRGDQPKAVPAGVRELEQIGEALRGAAVTLAERAAERDAAAAALRRSEERMRAAVDAAEVGTWRIDLVTGEDDWDASLCRIVGLDPAPSLHHLSDSYRVVHPEDHALVRTAWRRFVEEGGAYDIDMRIVRPDGEVLWVRDRGQLVRDAEGRPFYATGAVVDITRRKLAEEAQRQLAETLEHRVIERTAQLEAANRALQEEVAERHQAEAQLVQAQKMEAVGQLTGGVAHDFNNLLTAILGNIELARGRAADPVAARLLDNAARAAERGAKLTEQLLAFSRKQHLKPRAVDINALIAGMGDMLTRTIGALIHVETAPGRELWPALVDANQIELAILNLAVNARDAMPLGGSLLIETANVAAGSDLPADLTPGDYVVISVTDTGSGMSAEVLAKAFEPFFTTKEVGKGSGLGLSQVYGVARQSGGTVKIASRPGAGTTVRIYAPRARVAAEPVNGQAAASADFAAQRAVILLVDDDPGVRSFAATCLRQSGHEVAEAGSGRAALDVLAAEGSIDLLIVDFAMPGINGAELARTARVSRPDLAILFATGYADAKVLEAELGDALLLKKPFRVAELLAAVGRTIAARSGRGATVVPLRPGQAG